LIATIATESGGTLQEPSQDFSVAVTTTNAPAIRRGRPRQSRKRVSEEGKGISPNMPKYSAKVAVFAGRQLRALTSSDGRST
jgi:hypothetical protein